MKKYLPIGFLLLSLFYVSSIQAAKPFENYDTTVFGSLSWGDGENFWIHNYWYPAKGVGVTHTGRDYHTPSFIKRVKDSGRVVSYGFGKVVDLKEGVNGKKLSYYTVENLLRSGEVADVNLFHAKIDMALAPQKFGYIAKQQYIGIESNQGAGLPSHLHVEVSDKPSPAWVCTNTARPGISGNPDNSLAKDNLQAHYGDGYCKVGTRLQYNNQSPIYFSPGEVFALSELLPYLSINNPTPSFDDYNVYGIANQPLYGQLQMHRDNSKTFQGVGILIKGGTDRQNPLDIPLLVNNQWNGKWLARTWVGDVDYNNSSVAKVTIQGDLPITDDHTYTQPGDYQVISFVAETAENLKKGYPIIFSILDSERSKIIDNDKTTEKQADSSMREVYSQSLGSPSNKLGPKDNITPGYYLTGQLVRGQSGAYAQWKPGLVGDYRMYAFVPPGSSGKKVVYKIKEDGTDATMKAACVIQENQGGYWAPLVWSELTDSDGNGAVNVADLACQGIASSTEATIFNLQDMSGDGWGDGYVGLVLSKTAKGTDKSPTSNVHMTEKDWLSFDAIKFEAVDTLGVSNTITVTPGELAAINDTGINNGQCYQQNSDTLVACTSAAATALSNSQDGMVGRDVTANTNSDGHAGFSFTKISSTGAELPVTADSWACVKDNVTGLMWENKTADGGLHDGNNNYTYYSADYGANNLGAATDASGFVATVNQQSLCGASAWRLPSVDELQSIVDYSIAYPEPTIDTAFFPSTQSAFWSSSPNAGDPNDAWGVYFHKGDVDYYNREDSLSVRLVRASQ